MFSSHGREIGPRAGGMLDVTIVKVNPSGKEKPITSMPAFDHVGLEMNHEANSAQPPHLGMIV